MHTRHFIRYNLWMLGFAFRIKKLLETFLRYSLHVDVTASHGCCRFASWWQSPVPPHPKGPLQGSADWRPFESSQLSCSRNQSKMIWAWCHVILNGPSDDWCTVAIKGWTWSATAACLVTNNPLTPAQPAGLIALSHHPLQAFFS